MRLRAFSVAKEVGRNKFWRFFGAVDFRDKIFFEKQNGISVTMVELRVILDTGEIYLVLTALWRAARLWMSAGTWTSNQWRQPYLLYVSMLMFDSNWEFSMSSTTSFDPHFEKVRPFRASYLIFYFTMLLMTSRKVFSCNKIVGQLLEIRMWLETSRYLKAC